MLKKINLLGCSLESLERFFSEIGESMFRAKQLMNWIHQKGVIDFNSMTNFNKSLREKLKEIAIIEPPKIIEEHISEEGTIKYLVEIESGSMVEMVVIPEKNRRTLCVSSQAGCALQCTFCATGAQGFDQDLKSSEIVGQLWLANFHAKDSKPITNIVFMGMGEPLLNYSEVKKAVMILMNDKGLDFSRRRITLSTAGVVPLIKKAHDELGCMIAISLHATDDKTRNILVPLNKKWPIDAIIKTLKDDLKLRNSERITFEYVMLKDVNDTEFDAKRLVKIIQGLPSKINLIPFNKWVGSGYERSPQKKIQAFSQIIKKAGFPSPVRAPRGEDIMAACGQLKSSTLKKRLNNA